MRIKIIQSFAEVGHATFRVGELLTFPEAIALEWINLKRAVALEPADTHPVIPIPKETTSRKRRSETR